MSMTVTASAGLNPTLASMLAQLTGANPAPANFSFVAAGAGSSAAVGTSNAVTGSGKAQVSNEILGLFSKMHQAAGSGGGGSAGSSSASTTTLSTASTMADPLSKMLATLDTDQEAMLAQSDDGDSDFASLYALNGGAQTSG